MSAHFFGGTVTAIIPASNPLADLGPANLQTSSISQYRTLTNAGLHADYSYVKGINNLKIGAQYDQTFLHEHDSPGRGRSNLLGRLAGWHYGQYRSLC